jgi:ABC-type glutathione transport system ATPase component
MLAGAGMTTLLKLENVTKTYVQGGILPWRRRANEAIKGVDLEVTRGSVMGLVGESGCGKSTLAKIILRLEQATAGRVIFDGTDITHLSRQGLQPFRRRIQMVFQDANSSLNPRKTVKRLMTEALAQVHVVESTRTARAGELLEQVGLSAAVLSRYPHELSGGQKQRMAIARALAMGPDLLVADEPVSSLDVSLQAQIMRLLMDLNKRLGLTMVFISHDLALVHHICSDVAVMCAGNIVERGKPAQVLNAPEHPYTRSLLASVPRARFRQAGTAD